MLAVLPHRFDDDQRRLGWDRAKYLDPPLLAVDEAMLLHWVVLVRPAHLVPQGANRSRHGVLHLRLHGPTFLIRGQTQIPVRHGHDGLPHVTRRTTGMEWVREPTACPPRLKAGQAYP